MRTNRLIGIALVTALASVIAGCGKTESDGNAVSTEVKGSATVMQPGDNVKSANAQEVSDPSQVKDGGSFRLTPPDPNDPKFKPDPKLAGGG